MATGSKQFVIAVSAAAAVDKENVAAAARETTPKTKAAAVALIALYVFFLVRKEAPKEKCFKFSEKAPRARKML